MSAATTVRFDEVDKIEATDLLKSMGISFNGYLAMAVKQLINQRRIPFEIVPPRNVPTEETRMAMLRAEAKAAGLIPDNDPGFTDPDEFFASLEE